MDKFEKEFKNLGRRIRQIRKGKNISVAKLSEKTGICKSYLYKIENGKAYGLLVYKHLSAIAYILGVRCSYLLENI